MIWRKQHHLPPSFYWAYLIGNAKQSITWEGSCGSQVIIYQDINMHIFCNKTKNSPLTTGGTWCMELEIPPTLIPYFTSRHNDKTRKAATSWEWEWRGGAVTGRTKSHYELVYLVEFCCIQVCLLTTSDQYRTTLVQVIIQRLEGWGFDPMPLQSVCFWSLHNSE